MRADQWAQGVLIRCFVVLGLALGAGVATQAQTVWTNPGTDSWLTAGNWSLGVPNVASPTAFDAIIANGGTAQLLGPGGSVRRLRVGLVGGGGNLLIDAGELTVSENLRLNEGSVAAATVTVQGGSTVTAPSTVVGYSSNTPTSLIVRGAGTTYNATTELIVGRSGIGPATLTVDEGGNVIAASTTLGQFAGSNASTTVTGPGSLLSQSGALTVGSAGIATLNILDQGVVSVGTTLTINASSTINLNGGTLRFATISGVGAIIGAGGVNRINYTAGTIQFPFAGLGTAPITSLFGAIPSIGVGKSLVVDNTAFLNAGESVFVSGGQLQVESLYFDFGGYLGISDGGAVINSDLVVRGGLGVVGPNASLHVNGSLTVESGTGLGSPNAILQVEDGASVFIDGDLVINHPDFNFPPLAAVNMYGGTLRFDDYSKTNSAFGAQFNYTGGTIQLAGDRDIGNDATVPQLFGASPIIAAGKGLTIEGTARLSTVPLTLAGGTLSAGTLAVLTGGRLQTTQDSQASGPVVALPGSVIDATGGALVIGHATKVNGFYGNGTLLTGANTVTLLDANDAVFDSASLVTLGDAGTPGTLIADNGLTLDFGANLTGFGEVNTPDVLAKPLINNGHITGDSVSQPITLPGYVKGVGTFDNVLFTGTFSPGLSPTQMSVGSVAFASTNTLVMEIGGSNPGSGYDRLVGDGTIALDGVLKIDLINGFVPLLGQSFDIVTADSVTGGFEMILGKQYAPGRSWVLTYFPDGVSLTAARLADLDADGDIDDADFGIAFAAFTGPNNGPSSNPNADLDSDGDVDDADFGIAFAAFTGPGGSVNVPEPASLAIMGLGGLLLTRRRVR